jgi:hypothetical protein
MTACATLPTLRKKTAAARAASPFLILFIFSPPSSKLDFSSSNNYNISLAVKVSACALSVWPWPSSPPTTLAVFNLSGPLSHFLDHPLSSELVPSSPASGSRWYHWPSILTHLSNIEEDTERESPGKRYCTCNSTSASSSFSLID